MQSVNLYLSKVEYWDLVVGKHGTLKGQGYRQALRECPQLKLPEVLARFWDMTQHYKHPCKNPFRELADIHQSKTQTFCELLDWAAEAFARSKQSLHGSGALTVSQTTTLQKRLPLVGHGWSSKTTNIVLR